MSTAYAKINEGLKELGLTSRMIDEIIGQIED